MERHLPVETHSPQKERILNELRELANELKFGIMRLTHVTDDAIAAHAHDVERTLNSRMRRVKREVRLLIESGIVRR